jgi:GNAT superfamily N-acetyltransferase
VLAGSVLKGVTLPHVAQIYGSWFIRGMKVDRWDTDRRERVGVLLQERLNPVTEQEALPVTEAWAHLRMVMGLHPNTLAALPRREARQRLYDASVMLEKRLRAMPQKMAHDVAEALSELRGVGVYSIDVHGGNIGRSGDTFMLFDVGSSSSPAHAEAPEVHGEAAEAGKKREASAQTPYVVMEWVSVDEIDGEGKESPRDQIIEAYNDAGSYGIDVGNLTQDGRTVGEIWISTDGEQLDLSKILIHPLYRGRGYARGAIEQLNKLADERGLTIVLSPGDDFGASVPRLKRFYKSLGFVENRGRKIDYAISDTMYRLPRGGGKVAREDMRASDHGHIERSYDLPGGRTNHQVVVGRYIVMVTVADGDVSYSEVYEGLLREPARPCAESRKAELRARSVVRGWSGGHEAAEDGKRRLRWRG